jgi:AbrB family looped-hinge helix DNA binding protein
MVKRYQNRLQSRARSAAVGDGRIHGMKTTIDAAGRLVVPKELRRELKLNAGTVVDINIRNGVLEIVPAATPMRLVRKGKSLVATTDEPLPVIGPQEVRSVTESLRR